MAAAVEAGVEEATTIAATMTTCVTTTRTAVGEEATKMGVEVAVGTIAEVDTVVKVATHRRRPTLHPHFPVATFLRRQEVPIFSLPHLQDGCLRLV